MSHISSDTSNKVLGLDAGGTQVRWALADTQGRMLSEGVAGGLSGLNLVGTDGRAGITATLHEIAAATGPVRAIVAGITGFDDTQQGAMLQFFGNAFGITPAGVHLMGDLELVCRAAFAPGEGYVVYAGTGSVAAFIDADGELHRAGGRGVIIDDAGSGHWIAREALRRIWRAEDLTPGVWQQSPLARHVFERMGGHTWAQTKTWVYGASRGELGTLALAVAAAAKEDPAALHILQAAGVELAHLALALRKRLGTRPVALAGRAFDLHPAVEHSLRAVLPPATPIRRAGSAFHHAAARLAATHALTRTPA